MAARFSDKTTLTALLSTLDVFLGQAKAVLFSVWLQKCFYTESVVTPIMNVVYFQ